MRTNLGQLGFQNHLASGGGAPAPGWADERRAQAVEGKGEGLIIPAQRADQAGTQMQDGAAAPDPRGVWAVAFIGGKIQKNRRSPLGRG